MEQRPIPEKFLVSFSFAGEQRDLVRSIAAAVELKLGTGMVFLDEWFEAFIAGADADLTLQHIYHEKSVLVVSCISGDYESKPWTQAEWTAIRAFVMKLKNSNAEVDRHRHLPIRVGEGDVAGLFINTICPDVRQRTPEQSAQLIVNKLNLIQPQGTHSLSSVAGAISRPAPIAPPQHDTGMMAEDNPWYIERKADERAFRALNNGARTIAITGLRMSGTDSMAVRLGKRLKDKGYLQIAIDLKADLSNADMTSAAHFFSAIAKQTASQLSMLGPAPNAVVSQETLAQYFAELAAPRGGKLLLILHSFDHLFEQRASLEIQSRLRAYHNSTSITRLRELRLILVYTRQPPTYNSPLDGSVFDIAEVFEASDFTVQETAQLVSLYGNPLSEAEILSLHSWLAGHPGFTRRALNHMVEEGASYAQFEAEMASSGGIFLADLRKMLRMFETVEFEPFRTDLALTMSRKPCRSEVAFEVLHSLGLIRGTFVGDVQPRCTLFEKWLSPKLQPPPSA